jgi:hypothetical protein
MLVGGVNDDVAADGGTTADTSEATR